MYVGIKYIGNNETKEDTICNTGAVWAKDEVLNFEEESAKKLAVHTDSFMLVDMSPEVKTFSNKTVNTADSYEPFPSLASMDKEQIANLASVRYGIKIEIEGREKQEVLFDALNRIKAANLRADATELGVSVLPVVSMTVTDEEYKKYLAGSLELKLVTKTAKKTEPVAVVVEEAATQTPDNSVNVLAETDLNVVADTNPLPTLTELLAGLDKKALIEFAKENSVTYANTMNEEKLRAKILRELEPA